jgi:hypothetical protein
VTICDDVVLFVSLGGVFYLWGNVFDDVSTLVDVLFPKFEL